MGARRTPRGLSSTADPDLLRLLSFAEEVHYIGGRLGEWACLIVHVSCAEGESRAAFFSTDLDALADGRQDLLELRKGDIVRIDAVMNRRFAGATGSQCSRVWGRKGIVLNIIRLT